MSRRQIMFLALTLATALLYLPVRHCSFVNYDDGAYVSENPLVQAGLTWAGIKWAFSAFEVSNWHPITWLSLMLDCQLFGRSPAAHHLVNAGFHALNAGLVFLLWLRLTSRFWPSAVAAALFAWHPLRVESVAWIAERKDVLSTFFGLLTLLLYARYAEESKVQSPKSKVHGPKPKVQSPKSKVHGPKPKVQSPKSKVTVARSLAHQTRRAVASSQRVGEGFRRGRGEVGRTGEDGIPAARQDKPGAFGFGLWTLDYGLALLFFGLGLMSKPMLVTLPFVFLLLDFWPLGRVSTFGFRVSGWRSLFLEKLPFMALSAASCVITFIAQHAIAMASLEQYPLHWRLQNAAISYVAYLWKTVWPVHLAVFYPMAKPGLVEVTVAGGLLIAATWLVWRMRRPGPWLLTGWLWYLGTLVPVIGLVQVGTQSMADRYTYLPAIGLSMAAVFALAEIAARLRLRPASLAAVSGLMLTPCILLTSRQIPVWTNGETLFTHTTQVTANNPVAEYNLGMLLFHSGRLDEAIPHLRRARVGGPADAASRNALGTALLQIGQVDEGIACLEQVVALQPDFSPAQYNLATVLLQQGRSDEALDHLNAALKVDPNLAPAHYNAATILLQKGELESAIAHFQKAIEIEPNYTEAHLGLGTLLARTGRLAEAAAHFRSALRLDAKSGYAHKALGFILLRTGRADEAVPHYEAALRAQPGDPELESTLAWVYATAPQVALRNGKRAVELAEHAARAAGGNPPAIATALAAAYAETGRFPEAVAAAKRALQWAADRADAAHIQSVQAQIAGYEAGLPFRDASLTNTALAEGAHGGR